ncbi:hypothetical protein UVI_02043820 [Ustilaginoidea virens]|uniref:Uncharacterized protein n=1 Tax=Ustilaginoidea virens TaxID=1159556 RepID=A0A1B5L493_USTVR|nr:hypothetical protein UVI_02043820 [Ustilaginoidea virens]
MGEPLKSRIPAIQIVEKHLASTTNRAASAKEQDAGYPCLRLPNVAQESDVADADRGPSKCPALSHQTLELPLDMTDLERRCTP